MLTQLGNSVVLIIQIVRRERSKCGMLDRTRWRVAGVQQVSCPFMISLAGHHGANHGKMARLLRDHRQMLRKLNPCRAGLELR